MSENCYLTCLPISKSIFDGYVLQKGLKEFKTNCIYSVYTKKIYI